MNNKIVLSVLAAAVSIIVIATILAPFCQDPDGITTTFDNPGTPTYFTEDQSIESSGSYVNGVCTVDGKTASVPRIWLGWDKGFFTTYSGGSPSAINYCHDASNTTMYNPSWTIANGEITITYFNNSLTSESTLTSTFEWIFFPGADSNYVISYLGNTPVTAYYNDSADFKAFSRSFNHCIIYEGDVATDMGTATTLPITSDITKNEEYEDIYTLQISTSTGVSISNGSETAHPTAILSPIQVVGIKEGMSSTVNLLAIIPLFAILAVLVSVAFSALRSRN